MNAIIYARYSPRPDESEMSIQTQLDYCREHCEKQGWPVKFERWDEMLSGADPDRPGLLEALEAVKKGDKFVVYRLDRLARDVVLAHVLEQQIVKAGGELISVNGEGTGGGSETDWLVRRLLSLIADYERRIIAARTSAAMKRHQRNGLAMGGTPPFGTRIEPGDPARLVRDEAEQTAIERVRALRSEGLKLREIARRLNEQEIPCRGARWHHGTVRRILNRK